MNEKIKVLIVDDHPVVRQGLSEAIAEDEAFEVVGRYGNGEEALEILKTAPPDIAILDISLPGISGLGIARQALQQKLPVKIVILTMYTDEAYFDEAMDLGVRGYLLKDNALIEIRHCLRAVSRGEYYICPTLSGQLINRHDRLQVLRQEQPSINDLTPTERNILRLVAENKTSQQIADELCVSLRTIQNHRNNICQKLGLKGHNALLQFALENKSLL